MNNKTIIEFGFRIIWRIMQISDAVALLFIPELAIERKCRSRLSKGEIAEFLTNWTEEIKEYAKQMAGGMLSTFDEYLQEKTYVILWNHAEKQAKVLKKTF